MSYIAEVGLDRSIHSGQGQAIATGMSTNFAPPSLNPSAPGFAPVMALDYGSRSSDPHGNSATEDLTISRMDRLETDLALDQSLRLTKDVICQRNHTRLDHEVASVKKTIELEIQDIEIKVNELQKRIPRTHENKVFAALNDPKMGEFIYGMTHRHPTTPDIYLTAAKKTEQLARELRAKATRATGGIPIVQMHLRHASSINIKNAEAYILQAENAEALAAEFRSMADRERPVPKVSHVESAGEVVHQSLREAFPVAHAASPSPSNHSVNTSSSTSSYDNITQMTPSAPFAISNGDSAVALKPWRPVYVASLAPLPRDVLSKIPSSTEPFTWDFLTQIFSNKTAVRWSPGFYYIPKTATTILSGRSFWLLETDNEPFLPAQPGEHGAKLTAFFNEGEAQDASQIPDEAAYTNVPVFIGRKGEYKYFGTYSQTRYSDKVNFDCLKERVPTSVKAYWAEQLSAIGRPDWVTTALMEHFWPAPTYTGPLPSGDATTTATPVVAKNGSKHDEEYGLEKKVLRALKNHALDLVDWHREARLKVSFLNEEAIRQSFENEDSAGEPGLRLWWEYLTCVGFDAGLYDFLVLEKNKGLGGDGVAAGTDKTNGGLVNGTGSKDPAPAGPAANGIANNANGTVNATNATINNINGRMPPHLRGKK